MELENNDINSIINNKKLSEDIKKEILLEEEKNEVIKLLNSAKSGFDMNSIKDILEILLNNEDAVIDIGEYIHSKYPNKYLCVTCDKWENGCKLKKNLYEKCNKIYESTRIRNI